MKPYSRNSYNDPLNDLFSYKDYPDEINLDSYSKLTDKITAMRWITRSVELRLLGYEWDKSGNKFVYKGTALTGKDTASKFVGLLDPFTAEINLFSKKEFQKWVQQRYEIATTFNEWVLNAPDVPAGNQKIVLKIFRNTLQNIADVSLHSKPALEKLFGNQDPMYAKGGESLL
jgi:hypothetical protein